MKANPVIKNEKGTLSLLENEKILEFTKHYQKFYESSNSVEEDIVIFLQILEIPLLPLDKYGYLEKDIMIEEVEWAIDKLKRNKAPGPDGILVEFYKIYKEVALYLLEVFRYCTEHGCKPES